MRNDLTLLELARRLGETASETRDPATAVRLVALAGEMLFAMGVPPQQSDPGSVPVFRRAG
jgi:hypothetical protein